MKILFIDLCCIATYNNESLISGAIAGTESTIIRVANALNEQSNNVYVAQHLRAHDEINFKSVNYISLSFAKHISPDIVIILRDYTRLKEFASLYSKAKKIFWMHDLPRLKMRPFRKHFIKFNCPIVCVSGFHATETKKLLQGKWYHKLYDFFFYHDNTPSIKFIYNLIDDKLPHSENSIDNNKLIFFSSPNKGLQETILLFNKINKIFPKLRLYIANPGYINLDECKQLDKNLLNNDNIIVLGALKHAEIIQHVRNSFCVFYPQMYKAETFGLIYLEANSLGTPVLAHNFGAAPEVLSNNDQLVDATNTNNIIDKLKKWRKNGRPKVSRQEKFSKVEIMKKWKEILNE